MNHTGRKRGQKPEPQDAKAKEFEARVTGAWLNFIKVRKGWKESTRSVDELLEYCTKLMSIISEASSVYNFRQDLISEKLTQLMKKLKEIAIKEATQQQEAKAEQQAQTTEEPANSPETKESVMMEMSKLIKSEMELLGTLAKADPKCYQIWYHRKWMFEKIWEVETILKIKGMMSLKCLAADTEVCDKFLIKDERNFHVWNYRSFLTAYRLEKFPQDAVKVLKSELKFFESKLEKNFSNYSAIHFKGKYLLLLSKYLHKQAYETLPDDAIPLGRNRLLKELEFVNKGLTIAPYEQSLWIYLCWLLDRLKVVHISGISKKAQDPDHPEVPIEVVVKLTAYGATRNPIKVNWQDLNIKLAGGTIILSEPELGLQHIQLDQGRESFDIYCDNGSLPVSADQKIDPEVDDDTVPASALIMKRTTVHLGAEGLKVESSPLDETMLTHLETLDQMWTKALQYVGDIVKSEPTNKEAVLNFCDLNVSHAFLLKSPAGPKLSKGPGVSQHSLLSMLSTLEEATKESGLRVPLIDQLRTEISEL